MVNTIENYFQWKTNKKEKSIEKKYENNEYTIIAPDTKGGVSNYDHIVVNPDKINEDDFVE